MRSIEWLAGLLEGEGCFTRQKHRSGTSTPLITVVMTDEDVVGEAGTLIEHLGGRSLKIIRRMLPSGKVAFDARVTGLPAVKVMWAVLPFMGKRRSKEIHRIVSEWSPRVYKEAVAFREEILGNQGVL